MRPSVIKQRLVRLAALGLVLLPPIGAAYGQAALPEENHYKVYRLTNGGNIFRHVELTDQFGSMVLFQLGNERFANPAEKIHNGVVSPMIDPTAHQMWWKLLFAPPQPPRTVIAIDQFGYGEVTLGNAVYLLNPALKNTNPPFTLPVRNHYLCYEVIGSLPATQPVTLIDQWGTCQVVLVRSKLFCNPVEKVDMTAGGIVYPIIDHKAHLQCYSIDNPTPPTLRTVRVDDQFGNWEWQVYENDCLCVPALKEPVMSTKQSTWGQIKALYQ